MHTIRLADETDRAALVQFIDQHWRAGHIMARSPELLDWQHLDRDRGGLNFVLGVAEETGEVDAVLGFITLTQFDPTIEQDRGCSMAIWKVKDTARGHRLGRRLLTFLEETAQPQTLTAIGASAMTLSMYQDRGYQTARMKHHYIPHPTKRDFKLLELPQAATVGTSDGTPDRGKRLVASHDLADGTDDCFAAQHELPIKTARYLIERYVRHPIYHYEAFRIVEDSATTGIVIVRVCEHQDARAIRVVDFVGPSSSLRGLRDEWVRLLTEVDAEYIDFYSAGIDESDLQASGFRQRKPDDGAVVPNHFEPFVRKNIEIDFMVSVPAGQGYRIVKGDGDQDRPSTVDGDVVQ